MSKVVAITGGFGVLGWAVGQAFKAKGAKVALIDYAERPSFTAPPEDYLALGGVDLRNEEHARKCIASVISTFGRVDVLINIAGGFCWETIEDGDANSWGRMFDINVKTALNTCRAALPSLSEHGGRIINVTAGAAVKAGMGMGAYTAAKSGVTRLTEALAEEMKDRAITVNAIAPSIIDTPQNRQDMPEADYSRWVQPDAIAALMLFLASDEANAITGAIIPITNRC
ncbi:MAG: 3-oxoacyl-[acyl-carrier-protein] reductase [Pseudomonas sp.]|nr:3-oxoacyl-[acyl-carrier-protein] reductase [Pseudomonas sp.]